MDLSSYSYNSLFEQMDELTHVTNKYELFSSKNGNMFRKCSSNSSVLSNIDTNIRSFVLKSDYCIVIPNIIDGVVVGLLFRSIPNKDFRYYTKCKQLPFGLTLDKEYRYPWIVVESALDCLFLKEFYPYTISTLGVSVSSTHMDLLLGTSPYIVLGLDNDDPGNNMCKKLGYIYKNYEFRRLIPPRGCKDFGDILDHIYNMEYSLYEFEREYMQTSIRSLISVY